MTILDVPAFVGGGLPAQPSLPIKEINDAYKACKFGLFHVQLLAIAFCGVVAGVLVSISTSYLLPSAECDLGMSLLQKGVLNAAPYLGMLLSTVLAGFLTDTFGRKIFVVAGYGGMFVFLLIAGTSQTYEVLVTAKLFEGILFATSFSAVVTLTSEFCHNEIRDRVMLCQSSFIALSQILIPVMSWAVLINDWKHELFGGAIVLSTWNFYLYIMSIWSFLGCILYILFIPESPKFLVNQQRYDEARAILVRMYVTNTRKPANTYPYADIWKSNDLKSLPGARTSLHHQLATGLHNVKPMFRKPLVGYLGLICFLNLLIMAMYNIIRLWFPQLSTIVEHNKLDKNQDLCDIMDAYTSDLRLKAANYNETDVCVPTKSGAETYINSIILGCVCLLAFCVTGILVNRVGKKPLFIVLGAIGVGSILGIRWATSKALIVVLFSISTAITQVLMSLSQALTLEIFPTTTRTLAIALMMMSGRIGTLVGNVMFPILLDMACVIPFFGMSGMMVGVISLALFIPSKKPRL